MISPALHVDDRKLQNTIQTIYKYMNKQITKHE